MKEKIGFQQAMEMIVCSSMRIMTGMFLRDFEHGDYDWKKAGEYCAGVLLNKKLWKKIDDCIDLADEEVINKYVREHPGGQRDQKHQISKFFIFFHFLNFFSILLFD